MPKRKPKNSKKSTTIIPSDIEKIPPKERELIGLQMIMSTFSGPLPPKFFDKLDKEHINKIIESIHTENHNIHKKEILKILSNLLMFLIIIGLVIFLVIFLTQNNKPDLLSDIIKILIGGIGGFGLGFGLKSSKK